MTHARSQQEHRESVYASIVTGSGSEMSLMSQVCHDIVQAVNKNIGNRYTFLYEMNRDIMHVSGIPYIMTGTRWVCLQT